MFTKLSLLIAISILALPIFTSKTYALETYEWSVDLNTGSSHTEADKQPNTYFNEENEGAGFTYGYNEYIDVKVGFFENSYFRTSFYAGAVLNKDFYFFNNFVISPGIGLLFATGYDNTPMDAPVIAPIIHPSLSFGHKNLRSSIGYIPYDEAKVITFQTQFLF